MDRTGRKKLSLVANFDELIMNSRVLMNASEDEFLRFVLNAGTNRRRWEHAELECQRLFIELTKSSKEKQDLEQKLFLARNMLDNEGALRKKAEAERDRLSNQLTLLRKLVMDDHLVDEIKLNKLRNFENFDWDFEQEQPITSNATTPKGILKKNNWTEQSIRDVEDFSFDDTKDLCESRSRLDFECRGRKRSRSVPRENDNMEDNRQDEEERPVENLHLEHTNPPRKRLDTGSDSTGFPTNPVDAPSTCNHNFVQKAIFKGDRCQSCEKRLKFGTIGMKCTLCRTLLHSECIERNASQIPSAAHLGGVCASSPHLCRTPTGDHPRSPSSRRPFFQSPMLK